MPGRGRTVVPQERRPAVRFAFFSSKYNELATGRQRVSAGPRRERDRARPGGMAAGPYRERGFASLACFGHRKRNPRHGRCGGDHRRAIPTADAPPALAACSAAEESVEPLDPKPRALAHFTTLAWLGAAIGVGVLVFPAYFDTRFALPIWPVLAVAIGSSLSPRLSRLPALPQAFLGLGFGGSLLCAAAGAVGREPSFPTYWKTAALIDELVDRFGVSNVVNVGNCAAWNVCKTGLMNELRDDPGNCFVLHDATRVSESRVQRLFKTADAVVVLGRSDLSDAVMQSAPGLNRGYGAVLENLANDRTFQRVDRLATDGLPELLVFVRHARLAGGGGKSKSVRAEPDKKRNGSDQGRHTAETGPSPGSGQIIVPVLG